MQDEKLNFEKGYKCSHVPACTTLIIVNALIIWYIIFGRESFGFIQFLLHKPQFGSLFPEAVSDTTEHFHLALPHYC